MKLTKGCLVIYKNNNRLFFVRNITQRTIRFVGATYTWFYVKYFNKNFFLYTNVFSEADDLLENEEHDIENVHDCPWRRP
jgi:hypothetical protein